MRGLMPTIVLALTTLVAAEIAGKRRSGGLGRDINTVIDWRSVRVPGQRESVTSAKENDRIAARDIPAPPLSPTELEAPLNGEESVGNEIDPIEQAGLFEGDIANVTLDELRLLRSGDYTRNAIRELWKKWPGGKIPYIISSSFSSYERRVIASAIQQYHTKTCIRFVPRTREVAHVHIMKGSGCSSSIGRTGGRQTVSLGSGCVYAGIVMHELMHATGFWHEQSRADRDDHVIINWGNIRQGMEYNFLKYDLRKIQHLGAAYDTCSVMHYGPYAFSKRGLPTIVARKKGRCKLGQREGFSDTDIRKLNTLYECRGYPQTSSNLVGPAPTTTQKPWVKPKCQDTNLYCATWARMGECTRNPGWMLTGCPVACKQCGNQCQDYNAYCAAWAREGQCRKNQAYMDIYCAKACKKCKVKSKCVDEGGSCPKWAKLGYCYSSQYKNYMKLKCKKSCKIC